MFKYLKQQKLHSMTMTDALLLGTLNVRSREMGMNQNPKPGSFPDNRNFSPNGSAVLTQQRTTLSQSLGCSGSVSVSGGLLQLHPFLEGLWMVCCLDKTIDIISVLCTFLNSCPQIHPRNSNLASLTLGNFQRSMFLGK